MLQVDRYYVRLSLLLVKSALYTKDNGMDKSYTMVARSGAVRHIFIFLLLFLFFLVPKVNAQGASATYSTGTVVTKSSAVISAKVVSYVQKIYGDVGDMVKKGQTLIKLDDAEFAANIKFAGARLDDSRASLEMAQLTLGRIDKLFTKGSIAKSAVDKAKTDYARAKAAVSLATAELEKAQVFLGYTTLRSPIDGAIDFKKIEIGELTSPGQPLLKIVDTKHLRFAATVKESDINLIKRGMKVNVTIEALGDKKIEGAVAHIVPSGDRTSHSYLVRIDLAPTEGLMAGMYGKIIWSR